MNLGVFVGSFNPPHKNHIKIVKELLKRRISGKTYFINGD